LAFYALRFEGFSRSARQKLLSASPKTDFFSLIIKPGHEARQKQHHGPISRAGDHFAMPFTPGLTFLAQSLFLPVALPGTLILLIHHFDLLQIPTHHLFALFIASFPAYISFRIIKQDIQHARHAETLGARLVPKLKGRLPGNLDILRKLMYAERYGYPGAFVEDFFLGCCDDGGR
jgi:hypothetical protein